MADSASDKELKKLFTLYTHGADNIGAHLTKAAARQWLSRPLLVSTGTDVALFPGDGAAPIVESFRLTTRGFVEMAGLSHLGPAMGAIVRMAQDDPEGTVWQDDAKALLAQVGKVRQANSLELWRDEIAVDAWRAHVTGIVGLTDYACALTGSCLTDILNDPGKRNFESLRRDYLEAAPVPFNHVMAATFALVALDLGYRMVTWLQGQELDWQNALVLITGLAGRPTAGLALETNNMAHLLMSAANGGLTLEQVYLAPSVPAFDSSNATDAPYWAEREKEYRELWGNVRVNSELAAQMFDGYPAFKLETPPEPTVKPGTATVGHMPAVTSPDDMFTWVTRLRYALEDSRELLSNCVANAVIDMLHQAGNQPDKVFVPGLTGVDYPVGTD